VNWNRGVYGMFGLVLALLFCQGAERDLLPRASAAAMHFFQAAPAPQDMGLVIVNDSRLPETSPHQTYSVQLLTHGGTPPMQWHLERGSLPPGIQLHPNGLLLGTPQSGGEFNFTVSVRDSSNQNVRKDFVILVHSALELKWKSMAHVDGKRIDGSVEVSNTTPDDIDLTFRVLAVAPNGRGTAIGYQHFLLHKGTSGQEIPLWDTLAPGAYVVHVDAFGIVIPKNLRYHEQLQTPPLQVTVGP
jgi:hypothetical protein